MRSVIFAVFTWILMLPAVQVAAQENEVEAVISSQIDAFRREDVESAFSYASPMIRELFRDPENFGAMVRGGYPMVWQSRDLRFLEMREIAGRLWQKVLITDLSGRVFLLDYQMVEVDGAWRINAVQLLEQSGLST